MNQYLKVLLYSIVVGTLQYAYFYSLPPAVDMWDVLGQGALQVFSTVVAAVAFALKGFLDNRKAGVWKALKSALLCTLVSLVVLVPVLDLIGLRERAVWNSTNSFQRGHHCSILKPITCMRSIVE
jgi:hypothetical protein